MAEKKYELLLTPIDQKNNKVRHQPWYKERLNCKYKKNRPSLATSWTFLRGGLDDFRDGQAPLIDETTVVKGNKGHPSTLFTNQGLQLAPKVKKKLTKDEIVYLKSLPHQRRQKERVKEMEEDLLANPLDLYDHIEDSLPPEIFEDLKNLLNRKPTTKREEPEDYEAEKNPSLKRIPEVPSKRSIISRKSERSMLNEPCMGYHKAMKGQKKTYFSSLKEEDIYNKDEKNKNNKSKKNQQLQPTHIEKVQTEFCDWIRNLGGEENMEESRISELFASGYETKPSLTLPVHVVELTNIPPELLTENRNTDEENHILTNIPQQQVYVPSWVKVKYGAWYLDPNTWRARPSTEPLLDSKERAGYEISSTRNKSKDLDKTLTTLHGAKAFRTFVKKKGTRKPEFLLDVPVIESEPTITVNVNGVKQ